MYLVCLCPPDYESSQYKKKQRKFAPCLVSYDIMQSEIIHPMLYNTLSLLT